MSRLRSLCIASLAVALLMPGPAAAEEASWSSVSVPVAAEAAPRPTAEPKDLIRCEGSAPQQPLCAGSFVLTGDFFINVAVATNFRGAITIRGETATGSVTIFCDQVFAPLDCAYEHAGVFIEGQLFTLTGVVTGMGNAIPSSAYWRIRVY